jgi:hypothetical protein
MRRLLNSLETGKLHKFSFSQGIGDSLGTFGISEAIRISEASNAKALALWAPRVPHCCAEVLRCGHPKSRDGLRRGADPAGTESRTAPRKGRARRPKPRTYPYRPPSLLALYLRSRTAAQRRCTDSILRQDSTLLLSPRCYYMCVRRERRSAWRCPHLTKPSLAVCEAVRERRERPCCCRADPFAAAEQCS